MNATVTLTPSHRAMLAASSIRPEVIAARGYRSIVTQADMEELRELGFAPDQCRPGLLIPVYSPTGDVVLHQLRPDQPRMRDGKPLKYETPAGAKMRLDIPPAARQWIRDPSRMLIITEGVKKADSAVSRGLCCVALLGVYNFRGENEYGGLTALGEWEDVAFEMKKDSKKRSRTVYICFDSDVTTKPQVQAALARLKAFLESRGAKVAVIYLPDGPDGAKVGMDDYFAAGHSVGELLSHVRENAEPVRAASIHYKESSIPLMPTGNVLPCIAANLRDLPVEVTAAGPKIAPEATDSERRAIFIRLMQLAEQTSTWLRFAIGDAWNHLPGDYGARTAWAEKEFGEGFAHTAKQYGYIAGRWHLHRRERPGSPGEFFPWSFYETTAPCTPQTQNDYRERYGKEKGLSIAAMRQEIRAGKGETPPRKQQFLDILPDGDALKELRAVVNAHGAAHLRDEIRAIIHREYEALNAPEPPKEEASLAGLDGTDVSTMLDETPLPDEHEAPPEPEQCTDVSTLFAAPDAPDAIPVTSERPDEPPEGTPAFRSQAAAFMLDLPIRNADTIRAHAHAEGYSDAHAAALVRYFEEKHGPPVPTTIGRSP